MRHMTWQDAATPGIVVMTEYKATGYVVTKTVEGMVLVAWTMNGLVQAVDVDDLYIPNVEERVNALGR